jgi:hypothetical protein
MKRKRSRPPEGFDELLVCHKPRRSRSHARRAKWLKNLGKAVLGVGFLWLVGLVVFYVVTAFGHCEILGGGNFFTRTDGKGLYKLAEMLSPFGSAAQAAINMMAVGGLIYSFAFVAEQVRLGRDARIEQEMPVVFIAPRLIWRLDGVSEDGVLQVKELILDLRVRNVGDAAATKLHIRIGQFSYGGREIKIQDLASGGPKIDAGLASYYLPYLPGGEEGRAEREWKDYKCVVTHNLTPHCADLLAQILKTQTDEPALRMRLVVTFQTVRRASFRAGAWVYWSPGHCRRDGVPDQREFLKKFSQDLGRGVPVDKYLQSAFENPLAPVVMEDLPPDEK